MSSRSTLINLLFADFVHGGTHRSTLNLTISCADFVLFVSSCLFRLSSRSTLFQLLCVVSILFVFRLSSRSAFRFNYAFLFLHAFVFLFRFPLSAPA